MRFSEHYKIDRSEQDDWFDPVLGQDTMLAADPYLAFEDTDPRWDGVREKVFDFFRLAHALTEKTPRVEPPQKDEAVKFLRCPEPRELCLGVSTRTPDGRGTGAKIAKQMVEALDLLARTRPDTPVKHIEIFRLFVPGVAFDLISDMFCNIIKQDLVAYTQDIARRHDIPMTKVSTKGARWVEPGRWVREEVDLPLNGVRTEATGRKTGIILIPERWLRKLRDPEEEDFLSWSEYAEEAATLRSSLNLQAYEELTRADKVKKVREALWKHPDVATTFAARQEGKRQAYDAASDPDRIIGYPEAGRELFHLSASDVLITEPEEDFAGWIGALAEQFAHTVEQQSGWRLLWDKSGSHVLEDLTQAMANIFFRAHCDQKNVQVSREVDVGRGLVDFHFSRGRKFRALIEVKHMDNNKLVQGASAQLPAYLTAEEVECGYLLCVGFEPEHLLTGKDTKRSRVEEACTTARANGRNIKPIFVDATLKKSASKLK